MMWSNWRGAAVLMLVWVGLAWSQHGSMPSTPVRGPERIMTVHENGKALRCRVIAEWRLADGAKAYQLQVIETGEMMTLMEDGPAAPMAKGKSRALPMRIFHWGQGRLTPPAGVPMAPPTAICGNTCDTCAPGSSPGMGKTIVHSKSHGSMPGSQQDHIIWWETRDGQPVGPEIITKGENPFLNKPVTTSDIPTIISQNPVAHGAPVIVDQHGKPLPIVQGSVPQGPISQGPPVIVDQHGRPLPIIVDQNGKRAPIVDTNGKPLPIVVDPNGKPLPVTVNAQGRPLPVVDQHGKPLPVFLDQQGQRLPIVFDPQGKPTPFVAAQGKPVTPIVTSQGTPAPTPQFPATASPFGKPVAQTSVVPQRSVIVDQHGKPISVPVDAQGKRLPLVDTNGKPLPIVVDPQGKPIPVVVDSQGRPLPVVDQNGKALPVFHDQHGQRMPIVFDPQGKPLPFASQGKPAPVLVDQQGKPLPGIASHPIAAPSGTKSTNPTQTAASPYPVIRPPQIGSGKPAAIPSTVAGQKATPATTVGSTKVPGVTQPVSKSTAPGTTPAPATHSWIPLPWAKSTPAKSGETGTQNTKVAQGPLPPQFPSVKIGGQPSVNPTTVAGTPKTPGVTTPKTVGTSVVPPLPVFPSTKPSVPDAGPKTVAQAPTVTTPVIPSKTQVPNAGSKLPPFDTTKKPGVVAPASPYSPKIGTTMPQPKSVVPGAAPVAQNTGKLPTTKVAEGKKPEEKGNFLTNLFPGLKAKDEKPSTSVAQAPKIPGNPSSPVAQLPNKTTLPGTSGIPNKTALPNKTPWTGTGTENPLSIPGVSATKTTIPTSPAALAQAKPTLPGTQTLNTPPRFETKPGSLPTPAKTLPTALAQGKLPNTLPVDPKVPSTKVGSVPMAPSTTAQTSPTTTQTKNGAITKLLNQNAPQTKTAAADPSVKNAGKLPDWASPTATGNSPKTAPKTVVQTGPTLLPNKQNLKTQLSKLTGQPASGAPSVGTTSVAKAPTETKPGTATLPAMSPSKTSVAQLPKTTPAQTSVAFPKATPSTVTPPRSTPFSTAQGSTTPERVAPNTINVGMNPSLLTSTQPATTTAAAPKMNDRVLDMLYPRKETANVKPELTASVAEKNRFSTGPKSTLPTVKETPSETKPSSPIAKLGSGFPGLNAGSKQPGVSPFNVPLPTNSAPAVFAPKVLTPTASAQKEAASQTASSQPKFGDRFLGMLYPKKEAANKAETTASVAEKPKFVPPLLAKLGTEADPSKPKKIDRVPFSTATDPFASAKPAAPSGTLLSKIFDPKGKEPVGGEGPKDAEKGPLAKLAPKRDWRDAWGQTDKTKVQPPGQSTLETPKIKGTDPNLKNALFNPISQAGADDILLNPEKFDPNNERLAPKGINLASYRGDPTQPLPPPALSKDDDKPAFAQGPQTQPQAPKGQQQAVPPMAQDPRPAGSQSVMAANSGLPTKVTYVPVPVVTVPEPFRPPVPPAPKMPEAPQPNAYVNAFSPPPAPQPKPGFMSQNMMTDPNAVQQTSYPYPPQGYPGKMAQGPAPYYYGPAGGMPQYPMMPNRPNPQLNYMTNYQGPQPPSPFGAQQPMPQYPIQPVQYAAQNPAHPNPAMAQHALQQAMAQQAMAQHALTQYALTAHGVNAQGNPLANPAMDRRAVPASNLGNPQEIVQLIGILRESPYPAQREWAATSLASYDWRVHPEIVQSLLLGAQQDPAATVRAGCVYSLSRMNAASEPVVNTLLQLRNDGDNRVRQEVEQALVRLGAANQR